MNSFSYLRIHDHKKTRKRLLLPMHKRGSPLCSSLHRHTANLFLKNSSNYLEVSKIVCIFAAD